MNKLKESNSQESQDNAKSIIECSHDNISKNNANSDSSEADALLRSSEKNQNISNCSRSSSSSGGGNNNNNNNMNTENRVTQEESENENLINFLIDEIINEKTDKSIFNLNKSEEEIDEEIKPREERNSKLDFEENEKEKEEEEEKQVENLRILDEYLMESIDLKDLTINDHGREHRKDVPKRRSLDASKKSALFTSLSPIEKNKRPEADSSLLSKQDKQFEKQSFEKGIFEIFYLLASSFLLLLTVSKECSKIKHKIFFFY